MYRVIYNLTLLMIGLIFAGCAYCAFLMYMLTEGMLATGWAVCGIIWVGLTIYWIIDCLPKRRRRSRRYKKAAQRRRTR